MFVLCYRNARIFLFGRASRKIRQRDCFCYPFDLLVAEFYLFLVVHDLFLLVSFLIALSHHTNPLSTLFRYIALLCASPLSLLVRRLERAGQCTPSFFRQKRFNRKAPLSIGFLFSSTQPSRSSPTPTPHNMILFNLSAKDPPPRGGARHAPASRIHKRALSLLRPFRSDIFLELLQKSLQDYANAAMSFKVACFWQNRRFHALFCIVFIFCHFCRKSAFLAPKTHFFARFSVSVAFCKKRRPNAPFLSFYAFLSLFATISSMKRSSENTVEMPVGGGNDITLSKCRSSPAR